MKIFTVAVNSIQCHTFIIFCHFSLLVSTDMFPPSTVELAKRNRCQSSARVSSCECFPCFPHWRNEEIRWAQSQTSKKMYDRKLFPARVQVRAKSVLWPRCRILSMFPCIFHGGKEDEHVIIFAEGNGSGSKFQVFFETISLCTSRSTAFCEHFRGSPFSLTFKHFLSSKLINSLFISIFSIGKEILWNKIHTGSEKCDNQNQITFHFWYLLCMISLYALQFEFTEEFLYTANNRKIYVGSRIVWSGINFFIQTVACASFASCFYTFDQVRLNPLIEWGWFPSLQTLAFVSPFLSLLHCMLLSRLLDI